MNEGIKTLLWHSIDVILLEIFTVIIQAKIKLANFAG